MKSPKDVPTGRVELPSGSYEFGPFRLDPRRRQLQRSGEILALTPKVFDLLQVLVKHADRVVEKDELMKWIWPDSFVGDDSLTQNVAVLRKVLGDAPDSPRYIATIHKHGYRFVASVREVSEAHANGALHEPQAPRGPVLVAISGGVEPHEPAASAAPPIGPPRRRTTQWIGVVAASLALVSLGASLASLRRRGTPTAPPMRFVVTPPENTVLMSAGFPSPDGTHVAFVGDRMGRAVLWVRSVDSVHAHPLPGTDGASSPFWSPDGRTLGFFSDGKLKIVSLTGGPPQTLASMSTSRLSAGGTWNPDGLLLFAEGRAGLKSISASGGTPAMVTALDAAAQETEHIWPQFLPDGKRFLYGVRSANPERNGIYLGALGSSGKTRVLASSVHAAYAAGYLIFAQDRALLTRPFDLTTLKVGPSVQTIAGDIATTGFAPPSAGILSYLPGMGQGLAVWFDRTGSRIGTLDSPAEIFGVQLSPDERQMAASDAASPTAGIWLFDLRRRTRSRLTTIGSSPVWSPDGSRVVFSSSQATGILDLYQKATSGDDREELLLRSGHQTWPSDWSPDGRLVVFTTASPKTKLDLWLLSAADRKATPYLQTPFNELHGQVSPDGRWLAYTSDESGSWEVYVQSFPVPGHKRTISTDGGAQPRWRRDGKELFYLAPDRRLQRVRIEQKLDSLGVLDVGTPEPLFQTHTRGPLVPSWHEYTVTSNGQRFLICETERMDTSITVLLNWTNSLGH